MPAKVRGRAACNQCRSRKQKCDEKRPICSRCRDLKKPCQWPGLRKRGPAKGYTEALEHRLRETESALLQIVSAVDGGTLKSAFEGGSRGAVADAMPDAKADKTEMAAYWEHFPLSTPRDIMVWAQEQHSSPRRAAGVAAPTRMQALARPVAHLGEPLSAYDAAMALGASYGEGVADLAQSSITAVHTSPNLLPGASPDSNAFDIPEQFKEQYLRHVPCDLSRYCEYYTSGDQRTSPASLVREVF